MLSRCFIAAIAFLFSALLNAAPENEIASRDATVEGVKLHYLTAGHGPAVILLHGYTQTSRMWRPIIPLLAKKFTVIAPDLPGIGDSGIPADNKIDMLSTSIGSCIRCRRRKISRHVSVTFRRSRPIFVFEFIRL